MNLFQRFSRKPYRIFLAGALLGGLLIVVVAIAPVESVVADAVNAVGRPFQVAATFVSTKILHRAQDLSAGAAGTLSKPAADYETAVESAVKRASPAVVSIVISKNVPIVEQCAGNPFANLPPDVRSMFEQQFPDLAQPCPTQSSSNNSTQLQEVGGGSGFIISSDGYIATNKHVAEDRSALYTVYTNDGNKYSARIVAYDPAQDIAILRINATNLPTVTLGDSDSLQLGQTAIAIGNALGEFRNTVSLGVVSGLARDITASGRIGGGSETIQGVIQTDAAINPGNSGGPLLNLQGQVIGINTAVAQGAQNIGFAIPINRAKRDITSVRTSGTIQSPYLGVRYMAVTAALAESKKLAVNYGALVAADESGPGVASGSPAAATGLKEGDVITQVNGNRVDVDHPLGDMINNLQVGDRVTLTVNRNGQTVTLIATLTQRP